MLIDDVERYIALRRSLGFQLKKAARHLQTFAGLAAEKGERHIRAVTVIEWAATAPTPDARNRRISDIARCARFLRAEDEGHEIPPTSLFATPKQRPAPYIYAPDELVRMLDAAEKLRLLKSDPLRRRTFVMLFGLIATTGLRVSEALNLRLGDVLPGAVSYKSAKRSSTKAASYRCTPPWQRLSIAISIYVVTLPDRTIIYFYRWGERAFITQR